MTQQKSKFLAVQQKSKFLAVSFPIFVGALLASTASAVVLAGYDFTGGTAAAPTETGTGVTANNFTETGSGGISGFSDTYFLAFNWTGADQTAALADGDYASVTISATNPGEGLDLTSLTLTMGGNTSGVDVNSAIYLVSDVNGFGSVITGINTTYVSNTTAVDFAADDSTSFDLSGSEYQGLASVTFQLRFSDDSSGTGNSANTNRFTDVTINGDVVATIPEPSVALLGAIGVLGLLRRRRVA